MCNVLLLIGLFAICLLQLQHVSVLATLATVSGKAATTPKVPAPQLNHYQVVQVLITGRGHKTAIGMRLDSSITDWPTFVLMKQGQDYQVGEIYSVPRPTQMREGYKQVDAPINPITMDPIRIRSPE